MSTSKKTRDEAVLLLSALACRKGTGITGAFMEFADHLELSNDAIQLARAAYEVIPHELHSDFELECLEAQYLVASGWEDGDAITPLLQPELAPDQIVWATSDDDEESDSEDALDHADSLDEASYIADDN